MSRPTNATVDLSAIHFNLDKLSKLCGHSKLVAVVKANAYGNGAVEVAKSIEHKVDVLAVAFLEEAIQLRQAGLTKPLLILQGPHKAEDLHTCKLQNLIWVMHSTWQLDAYKERHGELEKLGHKLWLKFDTGMHRLGLPFESFSSICERYQPILDSDTVIMTHLACADEPLQGHAKSQLATFLIQVKHSNFKISLANSAASIRFDQARQDFVRLGIAMYGATPFQISDNPISLNSVMNLESEIIALRTIPKGDTVGYGATWRAPTESVIATVALGYADGYPRHAPTGTPAWCNGELIPLVGRVSMDMLTFDVTNVHNPQIGDRVQLWGDELSINTVAERIGTIAYELMTRVSERVPRKYLSHKDEEE